MLTEEKFSCNNNNKDLNSTHENSLKHTMLNDKNQFNDQKCQKDDIEHEWKNKCNQFYMKTLSNERRKRRQARLNQDKLIIYEFLSTKNGLIGEKFIKHCRHSKPHLTSLSIKMICTFQKNSKHNFKNRIQSSKSVTSNIDSHNSTNFSEELSFNQRSFSTPFSTQSFERSRTKSTFQLQSLDLIDKTCLNFPQNNEQFLHESDFLNNETFNTISTNSSETSSDAKASYFIEAASDNNFDFYSRFKTRKKVQDSDEKNENKKQHHLILDQNSGQMDFSTIKSVEIGKSTRVFKRSCSRSALESNCFSVLSTNRTLDLEAVDRRVRDRQCRMISLIHKLCNESDYDCILDLFCTKNCRQCSKK